MQACFTTKPTGMECLKQALNLLDERGWVPALPNNGVPFGPEEGPLTVTHALWRASTWGDGYCYPPAAAIACRLLCRQLGLRDDASFVELGLWCRVPGRTQAQVLTLFNRTIGAANTRLLEAILRFAEEEEGESEVTLSGP